MTKEEFLRQAKAAAMETCAWSGLPAGMTVAQAALESGWGKSRLSREANNYFGIKAHGAREWVAYPTREVVDGREVTVEARFAKYASMAECFAARDRMILRSRYYGEARGCVPDARAFVRALAKRWATDPNYAEKVLQIYEQHGLEQLDKERLETK